MHCIMYSMTDTVTRLPYSVIMVESSNTSRLLPRQACAVESAVRSDIEDISKDVTISIQKSTF